MQGFLTWLASGKCDDLIDRVWDALCWVVGLGAICWMIRALMLAVAGE